MTRKFFFAGAVALAFSTPAWAEIVVTDAYARAASPMSSSGAAFMLIENTGDTDDRLIAATSDIAARVELHTHIADEGGVMRMREIEGGIAIPAGGTHALMRGGDHVMFMGITRPIAQGDVIEVTLTFEQAGDIALEIPVDLKRTPRMIGDGLGRGAPQSN